MSDLRLKHEQMKQNPFLFLRGTFSSCTTHATSQSSSSISGSLDRSTSIEWAFSFDEPQRLLKDYVRYYHEDRTHLGLGKDTPGDRVAASVPPRGQKVISLPRLGGLHHRYAVAA